MSQSVAPTQRRSSRRAFLGFLGGGAFGVFGGGALTAHFASAASNAPQPLLDPDRVQVAPASLTLASGVRVHVVQTGWVAVKRQHRTLTAPDALRLPAIVTDNTWTEWLPINTWVIAHPDGVVIVDTGETSRITEAGYTACDPATDWVYTRQLRFAVTPADEIAAQLTAQLDIDPAAVRRVVQTHLHSDHMGGIGAFPNATVCVPQADYPAGMGVLSCHFPPDFAPAFADFAAVDDLPGFSRASRLSDDLRLLPTPGHTAGHQSVLLDAGDGTHILFAGDTSFDQAQLHDETIGAIVEDAHAARQTLAALRELAAERPLVYLPTHDHDSRARLLALTTV